VRLQQAGHPRMRPSHPLASTRSPAGAFWEAEPEHQDYLEKVPNGYTCHFIRPDWKLPVRKEAGHSAASAAE